MDLYDSVYFNMLGDSSFEEMTKHVQTCSNKAACVNKIRSWNTLNKMIEEGGDTDFILVKCSEISQNKPCIVLSISKQA